MSRIGDRFLIETYSIASSGDIRQEHSFSLANNQTTFQNITGFAFANATVRSFRALVSVEIDATANLYEVFEFLGIQKDSGWDIHHTSIGDDSGVTFNITSAGQLQYKSNDYSGFSSGTIKFKAQTTSV